MDFLNGVELFSTDIRQWSGTTVASRDDIQLGQGGAIPPPEILAMGRKRLIKPDSLNPFKAIRKGVERHMLAVGTRFMGGYAIPKSAADETKVKLEAYQDKWNAAMTLFEANFTTYLNEWREQNAAYAHAFAQQFEWEQIAKKFRFAFYAFELTATSDQALDEEAVVSNILTEVGVTCRDLSKRLSDRSNGISTGNLIEQLQPIRQKLKSLAFGNGRLLHVIDEFDALEQGLPSQTLQPDSVELKHVLVFLSVLGDDSRVEDIFDGTFSVAELFRWNPVVSRSLGTVSHVPTAWVG